MVFTINKLSNSVFELTGTSKAEQQVLIDCGHDKMKYQASDMLMVLEPLAFYVNNELHEECLFEIN